MPKPEEKSEFSFDENRKRQVLKGLELTPAERLDWLDAALA